MTCHCSETDVALIKQLNDGNEAAAKSLFDRYANRVHVFAQAQFSPALRQRLDPDDIVQSVFHSFFRRAQAGQYQVPNSSELWKLLVVMALNKIRSQGVYHRAGKRDVSQTVSLETESEGLQCRSLETQDPELDLTIEEILQSLSGREQQVMKLRIEGFTVSQIADSIKSSKRTVERILQSVQSIFREYFFDAAAN